MSPLFSPQALGKQYNTEELISQLGSTKPMADIWKSGIVKTEDGCGAALLDALHAGQGCMPE